MSSEVAVVKLQSVPAVMAALDRLERDIENAPTLDILDAAANTAAGLQRRWKPVKEVADRAGECWVAAETKRGKELAKVQKAKGGGSGSNQHKRKKRATGFASAPVAPSRHELGVSKKEAARGIKLDALGEATRKKYIEELKADGKAVTPAAILAKSRETNKAEKKHKIATAEFSATGPFDCVVIDPPWPMQKIDREERPNQDAFDYPVMSDAALTTFWVENIAKKTSKDCHVFCWTTQKFLPSAIKLLEAWSLRYVLTMVWHKPGGFQPIGLPQYNCEFVLYARKGTPVFIDTKRFNCCFEAPRREHSRKPDIFYDLVRRVTGGSRIDVFSREQREGFAQFGNEVNKFAGAA